MKNIISLSILLALTNCLSAQIKPNWMFRDELIGYMDRPDDTIYVQDRNKLEKVGGFICNEPLATFSYLSKTKDNVMIRIRIGPFDPSLHKITDSDTALNTKVDGQPAHGFISKYPRVEISSLAVKWKGKNIIIPRSAYQNFFEPHICDCEAYITKDDHYLYLYIAASDGAGSYSVKFVFDKNKYVTRIVNRNDCADSFDYLDGIGNCVD